VLHATDVASQGETAPLPDLPAPNHDGRSGRAELGEDGPLDSTGRPSPSSPGSAPPATALVAYDGAAELDEGLSIVLAGLRSQLRA
jgi:hypothetical protein